ncbi:hypothetical protein [Saccharopolyspora thermophila]|nr:hypothetical protein [Saccharopolyspora subtropica]
MGRTKRIVLAAALAVVGLGGTGVAVAATSGEVPVAPTTQPAPPPQQWCVDDDLFDDDADDRFDDDWFDDRFDDCDDADDRFDSDDRFDADDHRDDVDDDDD